LIAQDVRFIDFAAEIALRTNRSEPEKLYGTCSGHFNKAGYRLLAEITADYLHDNDTTRALLATTSLRAVPDERKGLAVQSRSN
jgi:hypothetical protein